MRPSSEAGMVMALDASTALKRSVFYPGRNAGYDFTLRTIRAGFDIKSLRTGAKACTVPIIVLLVIAALGPGRWVPRSALGWQFDHFIGYFGITLFFCFAWPRPFLVGGAFMMVAALLEGLQAFTPDRTAYLPAVFYGAGGALAAAFIVELFFRVRRSHLSIAQANESARSLLFVNPVVDLTLLLASTAFLQRNSGGRRHPRLDRAFTKRAARD
jgi:VanZ family protein